MNNGGCQHYCINNEGFYYCLCREGYNTNGHSCIGMYTFVCILIDILFSIARNCSVITNPMNGNMTCTGDYVTDQNCTFTCEPGYDLMGSSLRTCLPNQTWSGQMPSCVRSSCPKLTSSTHSTVLYPCGYLFQDTCTYLCNAGYTIEGLGTDVISWNLTCDLDNSSSSVSWNIQRQCTGM